MTYRIYLDCCCLNRPFDDQTQERIRLESQSLLAIIARCESGMWQLITSDALDVELQQVRNPERRKLIYAILAIAKIRVRISPSIKVRAMELQDLGILGYDAVHIASAEQGQADIFLTTDDRLFKKSKRLSEQVKVNVNQPLQWLSGILQEENSNA